MAGRRIIKVFIGSPNDLAVERRAFKDIIDELNHGFGRGADVEFEPLGWEDALSQVGPRSQSVINQDVDACDVFVLVMWRRWGQDAPDAKPFTSYTEEEFYRALARFEKDGAPTIFVFFKDIEAGQMADPGEQLMKVLEFRRKLEETRQVLYRMFADESGFKEEIDKHLVAFSKGAISLPGPGGRVPLMPDSVLEELERLRAENKTVLNRAEKAEAEATDAKAKVEAATKVEVAKSNEEALSVAERAAKAALEGKVEEARQDFAKVLAGTTNLRVLYLGYDFYKRVGELNEAERLIYRWLAISGPQSQTQDTAAAYGNLGNIYQTRGELDKAEEMYKKALEINEKLGRLEGMAILYGNLGVVYKTPGELDKAEEMFKRALEINEKLGRLEGIAIQYGNLGLVYQTRGEVDKAEEMYKKALEINEKLGRLEGMAILYGNLGIVYQTRGELDKAEEMHEKALEIDEKLGRLEGMANHYGNLGIVYQTRGELDKAEEMHEKALEIDEKLGRLEGMANHYGNLGLVYKTRGELDKGEEMYKKALEINEKLGRLEGMAIQYENLGILYEARGDLAGAKMRWHTAKGLYEKIGLPHLVERVQSRLDALPQEATEA